MKIKNFLFFLFLTSILIVFVIAGCSTDDEEESDSTEKITLKMGGISPPESMSTKGGEKFAELIEEKTNEEIEVEFYPAEQLGSGNDQMDNLVSGSQDMMAVTLDFLADLEKDYNVFSMPYAFDNLEHFETFLNSEENKEIEEKLREENGIKVISNDWFRAPRVYESTESIEKPEDIEGMKFRVPDIPVFVKHAEQLGASPTPVSFGETYSAFQQNLVDIHDPTLETIHSSKFYEVAPYIIETNHAFSSMYTLIRDDVYQDLNEEQQQAIDEAADEAGKYYNDLVDKELDEEREEMEEEGAEFVKPDREAFKEKVLPMGEELEKEGTWSEGLLKSIRDMKP